MSKSLRRVEAALEAAGVETEIRQVEISRTAEDAAAAVGCALDQIAKSIIFQGTQSGALYLFLTAGGNRVDPERAAGVAGEALGRADAAVVRARTGFAIGGVAPVGHLDAPRAFLDPRLAEFDLVWAAAGTPHHLFAIAPDQLRRLAAADPADFTLAPAL